MSIFVPHPPYEHREPTSWGSIALRTGIANIILLLLALFVKTSGNTAAALFILAVYPIFVFMESLWVHGIHQKYGFFILSFALLLIVALVTTFKASTILHPRFSFPEIITQWHFYVYFVALGPFLSLKLSQLLFKTD